MDCQFFTNIFSAKPYPGGGGGVQGVRALFCELPFSETITPMVQPYEMANGCVLPSDCPHSCAKAIRAYDQVTFPKLYCRSIVGYVLVQGRI